jgi:stearoyl-CoA desaturase (delta-9 desaturase)
MALNCQINISMKPFSATANTITNIQLVSGMLSLLGLFYFDFNTANLITTLTFFYIYGVLGIGITLHRYYTHKSFEFRFPFLKWIFTLAALLAGRASVLGWVYIHRLHHAHSDTEKDPHSPRTIGFKLFNFKHIESTSGKMNVFLVKDLMTKSQIFMHDYYLAIILTFVFVLSLFGLEVAYFVWVLPVFLVQLSQNSFNYFAHTYGYRNYETKDTSTNNFFLWPLIMGDAWHNNHHGNPAAATTHLKWWEVDPAGYIIRAIKK